MVNPRGDDGSSAEVRAWAASGAMAITGRADGPPLGPPAGLVPALRRVARTIGERSAAIGSPVDVEPVRLLAERAAIAGLRRQGGISCGGATRLVATGDGWLALSLARPEDAELVPAWLRTNFQPGSDVWTAIVRAARLASTAELVDVGASLGLPIGALGEVAAAPPSLWSALPLRATELGTAVPRTSMERVRVVDLSSLWAGPLAGWVLAAAGADVVKVESIRRPDGARSGPPAFFNLLNAGKRSVALDLRTPAGRKALGALVSAADVVIEASRPRALAQFGIDVDAMMATGGPAVWASITGHGRTNGPERTAFGDDAAVAGGLVVRDEDGPCFCADAVADPITGLVAAAAILDALNGGGRWLLDISMAGVAAHLAGPTLVVGPEAEAAPPTARPPAGKAAALGEHTDDVLAGLAGA